MVIRLSKLVVEFLVSIVVIVAAAAAIFAWRLSAGPIPLGFLAPIIERALNAEVQGAQITFDETVLAWTGWERNLDLKVLNVTVSRGEGAMVARIPELDLSLSATALLRGVVAPVAIDVRRPRLTIIRTKEGGLRFGADAEGDGEGDEVEEVDAHAEGRQHPRHGDDASAQRQRQHTQYPSGCASHRRAPRD